MRSPPYEFMNKCLARKASSIQMNGYQRRSYLFFCETPKKEPMELAVKVSRKIEYLLILSTTPLTARSKIHNLKCLLFVVFGMFSMPGTCIFWFSCPSSCRADRACSNLRLTSAVFCLAFVSFSSASITLHFLQIKKIWNGNIY